MAPGEDKSLEVFLESVLAALNQTNQLQADTNARLDQLHRDRADDRRRIEELTELLKGNGKPGLRQRVEALEGSGATLSRDFYGKEQERNGVFFRFTDWEKRWSWIVWPILLSLGGVGLWFLKLLGELIFKKTVGG